MTVAPLNVPLLFEVTFDASGLFVAMIVQSSDGTIVQGPTAMVNAIDNTYKGFFTPTVENENYLVQKAVYTSSAFTTLDPNYSQGSESFIAIAFGGGGGDTGGGCGQVIGIVNSDSAVVGYVLRDETNNGLVGFVEC